MDVKGNCARGLERWIARASSSLPVPLSPVISTGTSLAAWSSASRRRRIIFSDCVMIGANASLCLSWGGVPALPTEMTSRSRLRSMARFSVDTSSSREMGFVR